MSTNTSTRPRAASALLDHLREPMRRSAYALIAGTGVTSLLGLVFWVLAAHWLTPAMVGIGAALISALTLLANISTLGLRNGLVQFLPEAGPATRRLVASSYALCVAVAMAVAAVFVLGQPWWADELGFLRCSRLAAGRAGGGRTPGPGLPGVGGRGTRRPAGPVLLDATATRWIRPGR